MIAMALRLLAALSVATVFVAGCSGDPAAQTAALPEAEGGGGGGEGSDGTVRLATHPFTTVMGQPGSLALTVPSSGTLLLTIDFGRSAFTGFEFGGIAGCAGLRPGTGVFPNSANWSGSCGVVAAGEHTLTWSVSSGAAQGTLLVDLQT